MRKKIRKRLNGADTVALQQKAKRLYRVFCTVTLIALVYLAVDFQLSGKLDKKIVFVFLLFLIAILWGVENWSRTQHMLEQQEKELKTYQMYIQPLEELVKEIRARQHEFDNHLNAICNMYLTVTEYDELVKQQSAYIREIRLEDSHKYINLLKISDRILAGFLYSKIVNAPDGVRVKLQVENFEVISSAPEHAIIEVVGTLVDNAFEAALELPQETEVLFIVDSKADKLLFTTQNPCRQTSMQQISHFFEKGYSTKGNNRGLGLSNAKQITDHYDGTITISLEQLGGEQNLRVQIEL